MHNVIVTGGSRGLGLAIARGLAAAGYGVIAIARTQSEALTAAIEAARRRDRASSPFDLADIDAIPDLVRDLKAGSGRSAASSTTPASAPTACCPTSTTRRSRR